MIEWQWRKYECEGPGNNCVYHRVTDSVMAVGMNVFTHGRFCYLLTHIHTLT